MGYDSRRDFHAMQPHKHEQNECVGNEIAITSHINAAAILEGRNNQIILGSWAQNSVLN